MPWTRSEIGKLVTRIQEDFLERPNLGLTLDQAARRFHVDRLPCEAVLRALADSPALTCSATGLYRRRVSVGGHPSVDHRLTRKQAAA